MERDVVDGCRFTGDAVVVHGVDAVGGDVHVEERGFGVAGDVVDLEDAFDGDAAKSKIFGELGVIDVEDWEVGAEPFGEDFHEVSSSILVGFLKTSDVSSFWGSDALHLRYAK